ncbi:hypothetical protein [Paraburkholderia azotifigens]|uniref:Uncharacterized protein n=1 Tax=Paraburkholderia azotifigens TaxID=2057004 RepID=A0A5C6V274_9BURK|nr:hypothetical protein [Paraburkholderia azotifigens]TXC79114.1 hypothetical protein FRZ40_32355 [Paraburkholderia azotifigens]
MSYAATSNFDDDFDEDDFMEAFVESIRAEAAKAAFPAFYVVPLSDVSGDSDDEDTDCLVAVLPVDKRAIEFRSEHLCGEARVQPNGIHVGCLLLADGKVPVSEVVFFEMELSKRDEFNVLWIITDYHYHTTYDITNDVRESMAEASRIADALNAPPSADHASVFEVFQLTERCLHYD